MTFIQFSFIPIARNIEIVASVKDNRALPIDVLREEIRLVN